MLFQAEDKNREVNVEVLRQHLMGVHQIDKNAIAVATGDQRARYMALETMALLRDNPIVMLSAVPGA